MNKTTIAVRYMLPAVVVGAMVAFSISFEFGAGREKAEPSESIVALPHGRCLVAVVEADGVYVGNDRIPFDQFATVFDGVYRKQKLDCAIVVGSSESRYGDAVQVYSKLREGLGDRVTIETVPVRSGTRWQAIETLDATCGWLRMPEASAE